MTADEQTFLRRLGEAPDADFRRLAQECGLSGRAARRLLAVHDRERLQRADRRRRTLLGCVALGLVAAAVVVGFPRSREELPAEPARRAPQTLEAERSLYAALDRRDAAQVDEARRSLSSEDESLRLAALRYLVSVAADGQEVDGLLALVDDPSGRVRPAALQLVGELPGPAVEAKLTVVAVDAARALAERTLALRALQSRTPSDGPALARALLPCLQDPSLPLREQTVALLERLTHQGLRVSAADPDRLYEAWRAALGVAE